MANETNIERGKTLLKALAQGQDVERAVVGTDGTVTISHSEGTLQAVDVADVDLLLSFSDGTFVIIPNGALDAISDTPHTVLFTDSQDTLSSLFKMVGISNPAKAGSLRVVSENIDAAQPPVEEYATPSDEAPPETWAAPAPMAKLSQFTGKGPGLGGSGSGEGEVPETVSPMTTPQPPVYRVGQKSQQTIEDLLTATGLGMPNITTDLYTSSEYKVTPSGRTDLPLGAYDPNASTSQLAERISPTKQATIEAINGTSGNDTIDFNPTFSSGEGQWSKTLHLTINNFSDLASIQLVFNAAKIAQIPGFELVGLDGAVITRDSPTSNSWHVTPTAGMLLSGVNIAMVYNVNDSAAPVDFGADVIINGHAGPFEFVLTNNLNFTWREAVTPDDFTVTSIAGDPLMVLPRDGVGVEVNAGDGNDIINSGAGPDLVHGGNGDDIINAGTGNDVLDGGLGGDSLNGGAGTDTATYENAVAGIGVTARLDANGAGNAGEASGDTYSSIENITGSNYNDILIGDGGSNVLNGGAGDDVLEGMGSADSLVGGAGSNTASYEHATVGVKASLETPGSNTGLDAAGDMYTQIQNLTGSTHDDTLIGDGGVNTLNGGVGNDILEGLGGADILIGGSGSNTASYDLATVGVTASLDTPGINTGDAADDSYSQIQNLTGSAFNDTLIGDGDANVLNGGAGDDILEGMGGADLLNGGISGTDTASYARASTFIAASLTTGLAGFNSAGDAQGDTYANITNLIGSNYNDTLIGKASANLLNGGAGDDILEGLGGADTLIGGTGSNTASYEHGATGVTASLDNPGINTFDAAGDTYSQIQNITGSAYNDNLIGDNGINILNGGAGDDTLEGMGGNDVLNGGISGTDTASYAHASVSVSASLTTGLASFNSAGDALGDTYTNITNLTGSNYNDTLIGNGSANVLNGGGGDDILEGLVGADTLIGGTGNNTASYEHAAAVAGLTGLTISLTNPGTNTGDAGGDTYAQIQNLTGSAFNDTIIGDGSSNILNGGTGDDLLEGMGNADILNGGDGIDTASYAHASTYVVASLTSDLAGFSSAGDAAGDTYSLVENLTGSDFGDVLIGNVTNNTLTGGIGDDILEGMGGADVLDGGVGTNTASYEHSPDQGAGIGVTASLATPTSNTGDAAGDTYINILNMTGSAYDDTLTGDGNANVLTGGTGDDIISGGAGADTLYGDAGNDSLTDDLVGAARLYGGSGDDQITITSYDNIAGMQDAIDGGTGTDTLIWAGAGSRLDFNMWAGTFSNSTFTNIENITISGTNSSYIYLDNNDNVIIGGSNIDYVDYRYALGGVNVNLQSGVVTGGSGNDILSGIEYIYAGSQWDDVLTGNSSDNWIRGYYGNDTIDGGNGTDTWYIDWPGNAVTASLLTAAQNAAMGIVMTGDAAGDSVTNMENIYATYSTAGNTLYGNATSNRLEGQGNLEGFIGADTLVARGATATASYANAGDAYLAGQGITTTASTGVTATLTTSFAVGPAVTNTGDAASDIYSNINHLTGSAFADTLIGNSSVNVLTGGAGDDILEGLGGGDTFLGGAGNDTVSFVHSTAGVVVDLQNRGIYTATNDAIGDSYSSIENFRGSNFNDTAYGTSSDNILFGSLGSDFLDGEAGFDTVSYADATGSVNVNFTTNTVIKSAGGTDILDSIERVIGSAFVDTFTGSADDNIIDGGAGADNIDGGAGSDTVSYASATGARIVTLGAGGAASAANTEGDLLTSIENIIGSNSSSADVLTGNNLDNVIEGGLGDDVLDGSTNAAGGDTASYVSATSAVTVSLATGTSSGGAGNDTLSNFENLLGSVYNDTLTGDGNANIINGSDGNDTLNGGAGADSLVGGLGTDTVSYEDAGAAITVTINGLGTLGDANGDSLSGIENLIGSAFNDTITGDGGANWIIGGAGNDILNGMGGIDTLSYASAASAVTVNLGTVISQNTVGAGWDTLSNFENMIGSIFNDNLTGDGSANTIEGGAGADVLNGGGGNDTASYAGSSAGVTVSLTLGTGADGDAAGDTLSGFSNLIGSASNDSLMGNMNSNTLDGGAGDDILIGGAGADVLIGGSGINTASYAGAASAVTANLTTGTGTLGDANGDTFSGIHNLTGSDYNDTLTGDTNANILIGGLGNDRLDGNNGNDTIDIRLGRDTTYGGNDDDTFYVDSQGTIANGNLPTLVDGQANISWAAGGGDSIKLFNLAATYSLSTLAGVTNNMEILDIRDSSNTEVSLVSLDVRNFVDGGNASQIWIKADSGDTINLSSVAAAGETYQQISNSAGSTDYTIFNASNVQVAQVHWQTA